MTSYSLGSDGRYVGARAHLLSPAKINLGLAVGVKRQDGFHEIKSLFEAVDLCDILEAELIFESNRRAADCEIEVDCDAIPGGDTLVTAALQAYSKAADVCLHARVRINKKIPAGAGLGGGSSNAGTILRFANSLCEAPLTEARLLDVAARVGSDVPFFVGSNGSAVVTGRGEHVDDVELPARWWIVVMPDVHTNTASVFQKYNPSSPMLPPTETLVAKAAEVNPSNPIRNDLEDSATSVSPEIARVKNSVSGIGVELSLSGSGSSLFTPAPVDTAERAALESEISAALRSADDDSTRVITVRSCRIDGTPREPVQ